VGKIPQPLEVRYRYAPGIEVYIRYDDGTPGEQDGVRVRSNRSIGGFGNDLGLNSGGILFRDLAFESRGNENVAG